VHSSRWKVVPTEYFAELIPLHLVIVLNSGSIRGPPSTCGTTELLCYKQSLLKLRIVKQPKLCLSHVKPVVSIKRVYHLDKLWRFGCQEVEVGGLLSLLVML
jgi:hypothetical protein